MPSNKIRLVTLASALLLSLMARAHAAPQTEGPQAAIELVDPKVFRVCADPRNLPFSNQKSEGFENKLAELMASKLGKSVAYVWYPGATGFVRKTLGSYRCDVIMGFPQGDDIAQVTNPYYTTSYALVFKPGSGMESIDTLSDPRLKDKRIGIVAGTPPATNMAVYGLLARAKSYALVIDTRVDSSADAMIKDIQGGVIDAGILWGPMAGFYAMHSNPKLTVVPLTKEKAGPRLSYAIGMAVRHQDQDFKRLLNRLIQENQGEINALLASYGVPLLDGENHPIQAKAKSQ